jgi:hypothetical protein
VLTKYGKTFISLAPPQGAVSGFFQFSRFPSIISMSETNTQTKTFTLNYAQDFGSIGYSVKVEANSLSDAISIYEDDPDRYDPDWLKDKMAQAEDIGIESDGVVFLSSDEGDED